MTFEARHITSMSDESPSASLLLAAITVLRGDAGACDEAVPGQRETATETGTGGADGALLRFARGQGLVSSEEWLAVLSPLEGGNEHEVFQEPDSPGMVLKVTEPALRLRNGRDRIPKMTTLHYLERWQLANEAFGDAAELAAVIETAEGLRIGIRQPFVPAADPDRPNPDQQHINRWLRAAGFEYQSGAWVRQEDGLSWWTRTREISSSLPQVCGLWTWNFTVSKKQVALWCRGSSPDQG